MAIKAFDSKNLDTVRGDIDKALASVCSKHGIALKMGGIRYSGDSFSTKLEAFIQSQGATGMSVTELKLLKELKRDGWAFNVNESHLGKTFTSNGETFKFAGIKANRPQYPVIGTSVRTGKSYKFRECVLIQIRK